MRREKGKEKKREIKRKEQRGKDKEEELRK